MVITIILFFMTGSRSTAISALLGLILLWNTEIQRFTKRQKIIVAVGLFLIFSLLPAIQVFRGLEDRTISNFGDIFNEIRANNNIFVDLIGELGGSMQPWLMVEQIMPDMIEFKYGQSYVASFLAIIPSFLLGGNSFTEYARLSGWLQETMNMSYGPGFSILAEAYYNFGWGGIPGLMIIGWLYFKLLSNNMLRGMIYRYKNLFSAIAVYIFITGSRGSMYLMIREEVYIIILPIILIILIFNGKKRDNKIS